MTSPLVDYTSPVMSAFSITVIRKVGIGGRNQPRSPGTKADIGRGTRVQLRPRYPGTVADFSRGTLWLDQSEAQEFWGLLIGRAKCTAADFGRQNR